MISLRNPREIWSTLKNMFKATSEASIDAYLMEYQSIRMMRSEKIMKYVNRMRTLDNKLTVVGHVVSTAEKKLVLLRGLRAEFAVIAGVISATQKSVLDAIRIPVVQDAEYMKI